MDLEFSFLLPLGVPTFTHQQILPQLLSISSYNFNQLIQMRSYTEHFGAFAVALVSQFFELFGWELFK